MSQGKLPDFGAKLGSHDDEGARRAHLARIDDDVRRFDQTVRASSVDKMFRHAWHDFVASWRSFYFGEKDHPSPSAPRAAAMYASDLKGWQNGFGHAARERHPSLGATTYDAGGFPPGAIRYEWRVGKDEVTAADRKIRNSGVREPFKRAWLAYLIEWKRAYAASLGASAPAGVTGWRRARAYRQRTAEWLGALVREHAASAARGDVGALLVTPGAIKDELETVSSGIKQLDAEITASTVRESFKKSWRLFVDEWQRFHQSKQGFWGRTWGATMEKLSEYKKRVDEWRAGFLREGGQSSTPNLNVPEPPTSGRGLQWWLVGGLLVGGAAVGSKVLR